ncbi:MAG TPA: hypothetical protein VJB59_03050 [Bdellovibrionota bacterium]|nr:hypothetical protein [Bdellovibrionota bacterium]
MAAESATSIAHKITMIVEYNEISRNCDQKVPDGQKRIECKKHSATLLQQGEAALDRNCKEVLSDPTGLKQLPKAQRELVDSVCLPRKGKLQIESASIAKPKPCSIKLPRFEEGCEGELCSCRPSSPAPAIKDFDLREKMDAKSKVVGHVKRGEMVEHESWLEIISFSQAKLTATGL